MTVSFPQNAVKSACLNFLLHQSETKAQVCVDKFNRRCFSALPFMSISHRRGIGASWRSSFVCFSCPSKNKNYLSASLRAYHFVANKLIPLSALAVKDAASQRRCGFVPEHRLKFGEILLWSVFLESQKQANLILSLRRNRSPLLVSLLPGDQGNANVVTA